MQNKTQFLHSALGSMFPSIQTQAENLTFTIAASLELVYAECLDLPHEPHPLVTAFKAIWIECFWNTYNIWSTAIEDEQSMV